MRLRLEMVAPAVCIACLSSTRSHNTGRSCIGPLPLPDWPGEGAIGVFESMTPDRESLWRQRQKKQGAWVLAGDSLLGLKKKAYRAELATIRKSCGGCGSPRSYGRCRRLFAV